MYLYFVSTIDAVQVRKRRKRKILLYEFMPLYAFMPPLDLSPKQQWPNLLPTDIVIFIAAYYVPVSQNINSRSSTARSGNIKIKFNIVSCNAARSFVHSVVPLLRTLGA